MDPMGKRDAFEQGGSTFPAPVRIFCRFATPPATDPRPRVTNRTPCRPFNVAPIRAPSETRAPVGLQRGTQLIRINTVRKPLFFFVNSNSCLTLVVPAAAGV